MAEAGGSFLGLGNNRAPHHVSRHAEAPPLIGGAFRFNAASQARADRAVWNSRNVRPRNLAVRQYFGGLRFSDISFDNCSDDWLLAILEFSDPV